MKILIDHRESRSRIPKLLDKFNIEYELTELEIGDYIIGNICIERKEINDYLGSLVDGRLHTQLYNLSRNYKRSYLVMIGYVSEALIFRKMKRDQFISSLVGASLKTAPDGEQGYVDVIVLENEYDFALFIKNMVQKLNNPEPRLPRHGKKGLSGDDELIYVLSSIAGLGEKKAEAILNEFKTLKNIFNAEIKDLMKIKGIGEKLANKIYDCVNREYGGKKTYKR